MNDLDLIQTKYIVPIGKQLHVGNVNLRSRHWIRIGNGDYLKVTRASIGVETETSESSSSDQRDPSRELEMAIVATEESHRLPQTAGNLSLNAFPYWL